MEDSV